MYRPRIYEASAAQIEAVFAMSDTDALARSRELRATHIPALGYYANFGRSHQAQLGAEPAIDIGRTAYELALHITDEAVADPAYEVAPYCIEGRYDGERMIRGIALWTLQPADTAGRRVSHRAVWHKADLLVGR